MYGALSKFYDSIYMVPDFGDAAPVRISSADQLLLSARFGRGNYDLVCVAQPLQNSQDFDAYFEQPCSRNSYREIVLNPDWDFGFGTTSVRAKSGQMSNQSTVLSNKSQERSDWFLNPVNISHHITKPNGDVAVFDGLRPRLSEPLAPGAKRKMDFTVEAPKDKGLYELSFSPVQEFILWFDKANPKRSRLTLEVV